MPYPPSFNNTPAKIIDPATGASTCALGNHRCTINMGNFTKNAKIKNSFKSIPPGENDLTNIIPPTIEDLLNHIKTIKTINRGKEANIV